ncbi:hypothetical protein [Agromyces larvae]|uniref:PD-(D/E)XK endonuclease-like domain-containing protein n=1 Tax=Agromyces larvae TaxID=2929802 RepID=A0ABY4C3E1_9MICO|nr:hypothetical protein [Agromyces larvae]UOE45509.1 hypothetical protein MTO99_07055 [Agromyces larvae]
MAATRARKPATAKSVKSAQPELVASSRVRKRQYGRNHAYYLMTDHGEVKLDGVTTLIGDGMRKKALEEWAGNETAKYAVDHWDELGELSMSNRLETLKKARYQVRDEAAARGTLVHALAERIAAGQEVEVPDDIAGHVESAVRFLDEWQIRPVLSEATVWSEAGMYGGTLDGVATSDVWDAHPAGGRGVEHRVILFDWKTNRSGIFGETALQLAGYGNAEYFVGVDGADHPVSELGITDHWAIWVRADGYSVYPMERGPQVFRTFQLVASVARRTGTRDAMDALKGPELRADGVAA